MNLMYFFFNNGERLANSIRQSDTTPLQYLSPSLDNSFYRFPVSESEIVDEISSLDEVRLLDLLVFLPKF